MTTPCLSFRLTLTLVAFLATLTVFFAPVSAAPVPLHARATSGTSSSRWVVYSDSWISGQTTLPDVSKLAGFNTFILSFLLTSGAADQAIFWEQLSDSERQKVKDSYSAAGIKLMVSAFGATEAPTSSGVDAKQAANTMADWVIKYGLDGIDVDYEDMNAMDAQDGSAEKWLIDFTSTLRSKLPQGKYLISHAPVAPWFSAAHYKSGAYTAVHKQVGDQIDWYSVQFYNQGASEYTDCNGLLTQSSAAWPKTSVFEIADGGVDLSKIVIGKPARSGDAANGFVPTDSLAQCLEQAKGKGWSAGAMAWEFPGADSAWINAVRGSAFSAGGDGTPAPAPTPSNKPTTAASTSAPDSTSASDSSSTPDSSSEPTGTSTPTQDTTGPASPSATAAGEPDSGDCSSAEAWSADTTYKGGETISFDNKLWSAKWWTQGEKPDGSDKWGVWEPKGSC